MDAFIVLSAPQRRELCLEAGDTMGLAAASVEKDFWVCWVLRELFALPDIGSRLTFKGGTSLSKGWKLIDRFSEDIDVVVDRDGLGFDAERSPEATAGSNERRRRLEALTAACQSHIREVLAPALDRVLREKLRGETWTLQEDSADPDGQSLLVEYPTSFATGDGYVRPAVKIEMGARSDIDPSETPMIQPYLSEVFPDRLPNSNFPVRTLDPRRTFWEKACLLHEEAFRGKVPAARLSRHYYDVWRLIKAGYGDDDALFDRVVAHRAVYFRRTKNAQDALRRGSLRMLPAEERRKEWEKDYEAMLETMIFGEPPSFEEILRVVAEFERGFNGRAA